MSDGSILPTIVGGLIGIFGAVCGGVVQALLKDRGEELSRLRLLYPNLYTKIDQLMSDIRWEHLLISEAKKPTRPGMVQVDVLKKLFAQIDDIKASVVELRFQEYDPQCRKLLLRLFNTITDSGAKFEATLGDGKPFDDREIQNAKSALWSRATYVHQTTRRRMLERVRRVWRKRLLRKKAAQMSPPPSPPPAIAAS